MRCGIVNTYCPKVCKAVLAVLVLIANIGALAAEPAPEKTIADYPQLRNLFPFGMYVAAERIGEYHNPDYPTHMGRPMMEPYRRDLLDMARHYINVIAVENTAAIPLPALRQMLGEGERAGILMWASENSLPKDDELEAWAERRLRPLRDEKGLLAWAPFDEPLDTDIPRWLRYKEVFEAADPNHPVIAVTHGGPKGFENHDVAQAADYYPVFVDNPNPWAVGPRVRRYVDATTKPIWFVAQAFQGEGRQLPTIAESRMMTYMAVAEGAKGIFYFIYDHITNQFNAPTPLWDDIGDLGKKLRAISPEMLDTRPDRESTLVKFKVAPNKDSHRPKDLPPAACSVLASPSGHAFAVVYNTSVEEPAEAIFSVGARVSNLRLYDLFSLVETNEDPQAKPSLELRLEPGSGRIFLVGDQGAYVRVARGIRTNCYHAEHRLLALDRETAEKWGVPLDQVDQISGRAKRAIERGSASEALALILTAREKLADAERSDLRYSAARRELDRTFHRLVDLERLTPIAQKRNREAAQQVKWRLDGLISSYLGLEHQFRLGEKSVAARAEELFRRLDEAVAKCVARPDRTGGDSRRRPHSYSTGKEATMTTTPIPWQEAGVISTANSPYAKLHPVPVRAVTMLPGFWQPRIEANRKNGIPQLFRLLDEHGRIDNFMLASGRKTGEKRGPYFRDSDVYKWMEGAAWVLHSTNDPWIKTTLEQTIHEVAAAQCKDGYLNTFFTGDLANQRFRNLGREHELYCAGHLFQAGVAHYRATGSMSLLDPVLRYADLLTREFGPGKIEEADGHPEVELALVELYRTTGERKYLDLAGFFLSIQKFSEKQVIEGHAVRAGYLCSGAADYFMETGDQATLDALERLWADLTEGKMYITGGIGARYAGEAFGAPYELPNEHAYAETCAAISNIFWNWRMLAIKGEARFADVMERTLYNGFLSGVSLDGTLYFYVNPLACFREHQRLPWYNCTCCPTNVVRMFSSLPGYFYSTSPEGVWVHLYDNSRLDWRLEDGRKFALEQKTKYPWEDTVEITVSPEAPAEFAVFLRIPGWCKKPSVTVNGERAGEAQPGSYFKLERTWKAGDTIQLKMPMPVSLQECDPRVRENLGSVAIQRGPVVYCLESVDNADVPIRDVELDVVAELSAEFKPDLLGGVTIIRGKGSHPASGVDRGPLYRPLGSVKLKTQPTDLTAIPYYAWANRGPSHMEVWIPQR